LTHRERKIDRERETKGLTERVTKGLTERDRDREKSKYGHMLVFE
jgi:hypothetical protein